MARRRSRPRLRPWPVAMAIAYALAFAAAWGFVGLTGVLLPALAALRSGAMPAVAWCMLGSAMAAITLHRMAMRPKPKLKESR